MELRRSDLREAHEGGDSGSSGTELFGVTEPVAHRTDCCAEDLQGIPRGLHGIELGLHELLLGFMGL